MPEPKKKRKKCPADMMQEVKDRISTRHDSRVKKGISKEPPDYHIEATALFLRHLILSTHKGIKAALEERCFSKERRYDKVGVVPPPSRTIDGGKYTRENSAEIVHVP